MSNHNPIPNPYEGLTLQQSLDTMRQLVADETHNHVLMGLLYNYIVDSKLLDGSNFKSPLDFICENIHEVSRSALLAYSAVARAFNQQVCAQFGVTRLRTLLTYKDAAKIELNSEAPGDTLILVPDKKGEVKPRRFADCSVEEMRQALARLREATPTTPIPAADRALVDQYRVAVTGRFPQDSSVRVQLRKHKGNSVVDFRGIPVAQVDKLTEALLEHLYPAREVPEVEVRPATQVS
jgi:hypothetical protein